MNAVRLMFATWFVERFTGALAAPRRVVTVGVAWAVIAAIPAMLMPAADEAGMQTGDADAIQWLVSSASTPDHASGSADPVTPDQRALAEFLAKRFRVASDAVETFVGAAFRSGVQHRVDPLLVLAVAAVESRFNPVAESALGAKGLMQVLPRYHQDKLAERGGDAALLDPAVNIDVGTQILRDYLRRGGNLRSGLGLYVGASDESVNQQYAEKVLAERARMASLLARQRTSGS